MPDVAFVLRPPLQPPSPPLRIRAHMIDAECSLRIVDESEIAESSTSRRSIWALLDQGAVSFGNCATNVILARTLVVAQWGMFMILLEAMLFLNTLQAGLVIYPLTVRGAVVDRNALRRLAGTCLLLTLALLAPLCLALMTATAIAGSVRTGIFAAVALALWQCQETLRRAMMSQGGFKRALPGDAIGYIGQAACVLLLAVTGTLNIDRAFLAIALTSAAALIVQTLQVGPRFNLSLKKLSKSLLDFWQLGRWVACGNLTLIVTTLGCTWTLAYFHGAGAVGRFQALANFLKLSNPLTICMAGLILPAAARAFSTHGILAARKVALRYGILTASILAPYYLFLLLMPTTAIHLLYGNNDTYDALGNQLRTFVIWYAALMIATVGGCLLNAIEQSRRSFVAQAVQTLAVLFVALPLTAIYGLDGLMLGGVIGNCAMAACYLSMLRKLEEPPVAAFTRRVKTEMHAATRLAA